MPELPSFPLRIGAHGTYRWLATEQSLDDLLTLCPGLVAGMYLAVTSFDSGSYHPSEEETANGWDLRNGIAYSPRIENPSAVPREGWDEWYLFDHPVDLGGLATRGSNPFTSELIHGHVHAFVNSAFSPHRDDSDSMAPYFWRQFDWICPRSYIAECDYFLLLITDNAGVFRDACDQVRALEQTSE